MTAIKNPLTGKPVDILVHELNDGIAGTPQDASPGNFAIYVDPSVPEWMYPGLIVHEYSEMLLEDDGVEYEQAHEKASGIEKEFVITSDIDWNEYNTEYLRLLTDIEAKDPPAVNPPDLYTGNANEPPRMKGAPEDPQASSTNKNESDPLIRLMNEKAKIAHQAIKELYPDFFKA